MGLDASIYSQIKPTAPMEGPLDQYAKVANLKALMGQNDLQGLQREKLTSDLQEEKAFKGALSNLAPGETLESLTPKLIGISPTRGLQLQKTITENKTANANLGKIEIETENAKAKHLRDGLAAVTDQAGYDDYLQNARKMGAKFVQSAPAVFDPNWQRQHVMDADKFITQTTPKYEKVDVGGKVMMVDVNPVTNPAVAKLNLDKTATPDAIMTDTRARSEGAANRAVTAAGQAETARHHKVIEGDPAEIDATAKSIAEGKLPPLSSHAQATPRGMAIMNKVTAFNPDFDPTQFGARQKAEKEFTTGKLGNSVRSFNVSLAHLDTLDTLADALKNGNMQVVNKVGNEFAKQTGGVAPVTFDAAKKIVADEIVKAIVGSGGGVADREEAAKTIDKANSPAQLKGVIATYKELMRGQLGGLRQQYEQSTGKKDFDRFLSDAGKKAAHGADAASVLSEADRIIGKTP